MKPSYTYACVWCPECSELMAVTALGRDNADFKVFDAGWLRCLKGHVRHFKATDMKIVELESPRRRAESANPYQAKT